MIEWQYHPYVALSITAALISCLVAVFARSRRGAPGGRVLMWMMLAVAAWALSLSLEIGARTRVTLVWAVRLGATGYYFLPALWLVFVLQYTDRRAWLRSLVLVPLVVVPLVSLALVWTSDYHSVFYADIWLETGTQPWTMGWRPGIGYYVFSAYAYGVLLMGTVLLVTWAAAAQRLYRRQAGAVLLAAALPWATSVLYLIRIFPPTLPAGPVAYALSGLLLSIALHNLHLLDIVPIARGVVVDRLKDAVLVLDASQRFVDMNPAGAALCGMPSASLVGQPARDVLPEPILSELAAPTDAVSRVVSLRGEGVQRWYDLDISVLPGRGSGRQDHGWVLLLHDVTALRDAQERAEEADRAKSTFISNVSHELRSPLTSIQLYLDLLKIAPPAKHGRYLETLSRETGRLRKLIEGLLSISRIDLGKMQCEPEVVDVNQLVGELVEDRTVLFVQHGLDLHLRTIPVPSVNADPKLLQQVITNLLTNALNYTPAGSVTILTDITREAGGEWVTVDVTDTGPGIPEDERERVFERFYRGTSSRHEAVPGTGLGLAISREIMEMHGGRLTCHSRLGEGSTFTIWLPTADAETTIADAADE